MNEWHDYEQSRDEIDRIIRENSKQTDKHLLILAKHKAKANSLTMEAWLNEITKTIPGAREFLQTPELTHEKLGRAYHKYWRFTFYYRIFNEKDRNIAQRKIYSFEYYFFKKEKILESNGLLSLPQEFIPNNINEQLFFLNPLLHFLCYRFTKEFHRKINVKIDPTNIDVFKGLFVTFQNMFLNFAGETLDPELLMYETFQKYIEKDPNATKYFNVLDEKKNGH